MNKMSVFVIAAAALAAGPAGAQAVAPAGSAPVPFTVQLDLAMDAAGLSMTSGEVNDSGSAIRLSNVSLEAPGWSLEASALRFDGKAIDLLDVRIAGRGEGGDGTIEASRVALSDPGGLAMFDEVLGGARSARSVSDCLDEPRDHSVFFRNVVLQGDHDALPEVMTGAETIRLGMMEIHQTSAADGQACRYTDSSTAMDVSVVAVDGARLTASDASFTLDTLLSETDIEESTESFELKSLVLSDASGASSASAGRLSGKMSLDGDMMLLPLQGAAPSETVDRLADSTSSVDLTLEGARIDVGGFLPDYLIGALGLDGTEIISGGGDIHLATRAGKADVSMDVDMSGLGALIASAALDLPTSQEASVPGFIADKIPVPGAILDVVIRNLLLDWTDDGAGAMVAAATGMSPEEHFERMVDLARVRAGDDIPPMLMGRLDAAAAFGAQLISQGGRVSLAPSEPVSVMTILMQALMNPEGLQEAIGLEAVLHK